MSFKVPQHLPRARGEPKESAATTQTAGNNVPLRVQVAIALAVALKERERLERCDSPEEEIEETSAVSSRKSSENTYTPWSQVSCSSMEFYQPTPDTKPPPGFLANHAVEKEVAEADEDFEDADVKEEFRRAVVQVKTDLEDISPITSLLYSVSAMQNASELMEQPDISMGDVRPVVTSFTRQKAFSESPIGEKTQSFAEETKPSVPPNPPKTLKAPNSPTDNRRSPRNHKPIAALNSKITKVRPPPRFLASRAFEKEEDDGFDIVECKRRLARLDSLPDIIFALPLYFPQSISTQKQDRMKMKQSDVSSEDTKPVVASLTQQRAISSFPGARREKSHVMIEETLPVLSSTPLKTLSLARMSPTAKRRSPLKHQDTTLLDPRITKVITQETMTPLKNLSPWTKEKQEALFASPLADVDLDAPPTPAHLSRYFLASIDPSLPKSFRECSKSIARSLFRSDVAQSTMDTDDLDTPLCSKRDSNPSKLSPASSRFSGRSTTCGFKFPKAPAATRRSSRNHESTCKHDMEIVNHVAPPSPKRSTKGSEREIRKVAVSPIGRSQTILTKHIGTKKAVTNRDFDPKRAANQEFWIGLIRIQVDWMKKMVDGVFSRLHLVGFAVDSWVLLEKVFCLNSIRPDSTHRLISVFLANSMKIYELLVVKGYEKVFTPMLDFLRSVLRKYLSLPVKMSEVDIRWIHARDAIRLVLSQLTQKEVLRTALATLSEVHQRFVATWATTENPPDEADMDFVCYGIHQLADFIAIVNTRIQRLNLYGLGF